VVETGWNINIGEIEAIHMLWSNEIYRQNNIIQVYILNKKQITGIGVVYLSGYLFFTSGKFFYRK
jgi:hypothetical protein